MKFGLSEEDFRLIQNTLKNFSEIKEVLFFGSRVREDYKQGSDIDIALKGDLTLALMARIKETLENLPLPYFFDVVDYDNLDNEALRKDIEMFGICILTKQ